jgi:ATP-dependent RNA helicase RhlB
MSNFGFAMPLQILKKIKALFKGNSSKPPAEKGQAKPSESQPRQGRRDGFSSRRERDRKRREHTEMSDSTNKVLTGRERGAGNREPSNRQTVKQKRERGTGNGERGTGNGERGTGNGERGTVKPSNNKGNRERETGNVDSSTNDTTTQRRNDATKKRSHERTNKRSNGSSDKRSNESRSRVPASEKRNSDFDYEAIHAENGDWTVDQFVVEPSEGKKRFHDFDIPVEIMHAIADLGFQYCTPIQASSLEQAMAGANVAGRAQTGTGKTAAYLVAILTRYLRTPDKRQEKSATPRALVIAPTRELCVQICRDAQALGKYCGLRSLAVFGGMDYGKQSAALAEGTVDLLAATPGRLLDFQRQHIVDLSKIDTLVIDEADRMLDMGFIPDVRRIIRSLPRDRQTLLYSATLDEEVMRLAAQWMPNPVKVEIEPEKTANQSIEQKVFIVTSDQKFTILCHLLDQYVGQRVLIFGNRRVSTDHLAEKLRRQGYPCELLSGEVSQSHRMNVLDRFREGSVKIVVATDVAGRGLHIADIGLVVNFELPYEAEDYVHRIGRTGRAGKVGTSVSFADEDESFIIPDIEQYIGEELKCTNPDDSLLAPLPHPQRRRSGEGRKQKVESQKEETGNGEQETENIAVPVSDTIPETGNGEQGTVQRPNEQKEKQTNEPTAKQTNEQSDKRKNGQTDKGGDTTVAKPNVPRAVIVPKGVTEQVWVPGQ